MPPDQAASAGRSPFLRGFATGWRSVFAYVLFGTFVGIGALGHDFGYSLVWMVLSTALIWAAPAQVILISALGTGAGAIETAVAVTLSGVRLLPMVVALLPLLRTPATRMRDLILPTHFTAISMWVESLRLLPAIPREERIGFCNGLSTGLVLSATTGTAVGFYLAGSLPRVYAAALLFLTPLVFLLSVVRNSPVGVERLAFALGGGLAPLLALMTIDLALLGSGVIGGSIAYAAYRWRRRR